jgi:hypothetical protein
MNTREEIEQSFGRASLWHASHFGIGVHINVTNLVVQIFEATSSFKVEAA